MTQSPSVNAKQSKSKYVSCIKINGVPILPPLITSEKRKELRRLKREAVKVEKRLQRERELKEYVTELYNTCTNDINDDINATINQEVQTAFVRDTLEITENISVLNLSPRDSNKGNVACQVPPQTPTDNKRRLSFNIQCAQYVNDKFEVFESNAPSKSPIFCIEDAPSGGGEHNSIQRAPHAIPKLIRSNSYTLDAPSPALMKFYNESKSSGDDNVPQLTSCWGGDATHSLNANIESARSQNKDDADFQSELVLENQKHNDTVQEVLEHSEVINHTDATFIKNDLEITSIEDLTPRSDYLKKPSCLQDNKNNNDKISLNELNVSEDYCDSSRTETELRNLSDSESHFPLSEGLQAFLVNNVPEHNDNYDYPDISASEVSEKTPSEASNWNSILKKIPSAYSRQILQVLEKQQFNQSNCEDSCAAFDDIQLNPELYSTPHNTTELTQIGETVYYSVEDSQGNLDGLGGETLRADACNELELNIPNGVQITDEKSIRDEIKSWQAENLNQRSATTSLTVEQVDSSPKSKTKEKLTREQAAAIITAAGKGFLIRRLMKTEKVQLLIRTINEAVLCAIQLHRDTLEHIEEADVELHRRLIQQVSAACYSFHSVFFATSIQDQMSFIAVDRQKKLEKMRRISSANSNASSRSNRSRASSGNISGRKLSLRS